VKIGTNYAFPVLSSRFQPVQKRKEQIGTYKKTFAKERVEQRQVATYTQKACSNYNYVIVDNKTYALTTTTKYTKINTVTTTKTSAVRRAGGWTYQGRAEYSNPPRDTATTDPLTPGRIAHIPTIKLLIKVIN
jgi:hypothetical protein